MKLKIIFLSCISLPILASAPESPRIKMPNKATILAILNENNANGDCFFNQPGQNEKIAEVLSNHILNRMDVSIYLHERTQPTQKLKPDPNCSSKANYIMAIAHHCLEHPEDQQPA